MAKTVDQMVASWKSAMASPQTSQNYTNGINGVTDSPMAKAAAAQDRYQAGVIQSVASGKFASSLNAVPLSVYKQNAINKGAPRLASGAAAAVPKVTAHFQKWAPIYAQVAQTVAGMPKGGLANAQARAAAAIQILMQAAGKA